MDKEAGLSARPSASNCCNFSGNPPVPAPLSVFYVSDFQVLPIVSYFVPSDPGRAESFDTHGYATSPPPDLQSLFCTLLI